MVNINILKHIDKQNIQSGLIAYKRFRNKVSQFESLHKYEH